MMIADVGFQYFHLMETLPSSPFTPPFWCFSFSFIDYIVFSFSLYISFDTDITNITFRHCFFFFFTIRQSFHYCITPLNIIIGFRQSISEITTPPRILPLIITYAAICRFSIFIAIYFRWYRLPSSYNLSRIYYHSLAGRAAHAAWHLLYTTTHTHRMPAH